MSTLGIVGIVIFILVFEGIVLWLLTRDILKMPKHDDD